jgi:hypothetical protein
MSRRLRQRPSVLLGVSDVHTAYCLDEVVYAFGVYVEGELDEASAKAKTAKAKTAARKRTIDLLLTEDKTIQEGVGAYEHDPTDPISPEVAAKMPPAVKFTGRKFRDPADAFKNAKVKKKTDE